MKNIETVLLLIALIAISITGCSGNKEARLRNDLKQFGLAYHNYYDANQKAPANWDELIAAVGEGEAASIKRVRDAGYEVTWNVDLNKAGNLANTVLAKPPGDGPVLMMDGGVPMQ